MKRIQESGADIYLVNTGWHGGAYGQGGTRFPIQVTRQIVEAITNGSAKTCDYQIMQPFDLQIPKTLDNISTDLLNPAACWKDPVQYKKNAQELLDLFMENATWKGILYPGQGLKMVG